MAIAFAWFVVKPIYRPALAQGQRYGIAVDSGPTIDWQKVSQDNIFYVYLRSTEGIEAPSDSFEKNFAAAIKQGISVSPIHNYSMCENGTDQAKNFLENSNVKAVDLRPAVSLADDSCENVNLSTAEIEFTKFLKIVEQETGEPPVIQGSQDQDVSLDAAKDSPQWLEAGYFEPETEWDVWSFSKSSKVQGIDGDSELLVIKNKLSGLKIKS